MGLTCRSACHKLPAGHLDDPQGDSTYALFDQTQEPGH